MQAGSLFPSKHTSDLKQEDESSHGSRVRSRSLDHIANITGNQAIDKVLPHLEKKTSKVLSIISTVFQQNPATVSSHKVLGVFLAISNALPVLLSQTAPLENGKIILSKPASFRLFRSYL